MATCTYNPGVDSYNPYAVLSVTQQTQSIVENATTVKWELLLYRPSEIVSSAPKNYQIVVNGTTVASGTTKIGGSGKVTIASGVTKILHNADGTKSISFSFSLDFKITWSGVWIGTGTKEGAMTLSTIARATTPTFSTSSVEIGKAVTIKTTRASSSFTHTLTYKFGTESGTIATGVATSYSWTVPENFVNLLPNSVSGVVTITCDTYNGSSFIGTKTGTFTVTVPTTYAPTITSILITDALTDVTEKFGTFVQNVSKLHVITEASGSAGSIVSSYSIKVLDISYSGKEVTTNVLTVAGSVKVSVTIKDSRGRTATATKSVSVAEYKSPTISEFSVIRSEEDGTEEADGNYANCKVAFEISTVGDKNSKSYSLEYQKVGETIWDIVASGEIYQLDDNIVSSNPVLDPDYPYLMRLTIADYFGSVTAEVHVGTGKPLMDFRYTKKGIAFGKVSEKDCMEVNMDVEYLGKVYAVNEKGEVIDILDELIKIKNQLGL